MEQIFQGLIDRTRARLNVKKLKTIFGFKTRPYRNRKNKPRLEVVVETPNYSLTIFKLHRSVDSKSLHQRLTRTSVGRHCSQYQRTGLWPPPTPIPSDYRSASPDPRAVPRQSAVHGCFFHQRRNPRSTHHALACRQDPSRRYRSEQATDACRPECNSNPRLFSGRVHGWAVG